MIVKDKKINKMCSFYVSEFHLEMTLLPYINEKLEKNEEIIIKTEKDLQETMKILMSKTNLKEDIKQKIINLGWNRENNNEIKENINVIIIGSEEYIKETNEELKDAPIQELSIIDCYDFDEVKDDMNRIVNEYDKNLNKIRSNNF